MAEKKLTPKHSGDMTAGIERMPNRGNAAGHRFRR
jgi:hypothetical protein